MHFRRIQFTHIFGSPATAEHSFVGNIFYIYSVHDFTTGLEYTRVDFSTWCRAAMRAERLVGNISKTSSNSSWWDQSQPIFN